jgi:hypothetical protein
MLVKVKTPDLPLHLAGDTRREDLTWNIVAAKEGFQFSRLRQQVFTQAHGAE